MLELSNFMIIYIQGKNINGLSLILWSNKVLFFYCLMAREENNNFMEPVGSKKREVSQRFPLYPATAH